MKCPMSLYKHGSGLEFDRTETTRKRKHEKRLLHMIYCMGITMEISAVPEDIYRAEDECTRSPPISSISIQWL